jgi:hypothetical protein
MRLAASLRYAIYAATGVVFLSGAAWLAARYIPAWSTAQDGIASTSMRVHGAGAMAFLVLAGSAIALHVPPAWLDRRNRTSGLALSIALAFLVVTGYCLYYSGSESLRTMASLGHWLIGLALPVVLVLHMRLGRKTGLAAARGC